MGINVTVLQMTEMVLRKIRHKNFSKPKTYNIEKYYKISDVKMLIETHKMKGADNVYVKAHINIFISNKGSEHIGYEDKCTFTTGND